MEPDDPTPKDEPTIEIVEDTLPLPIEVRGGKMEDIFSDLEAINQKIKDKFGYSNGIKAVEFLGPVFHEIEREFIGYCKYQNVSVSFEHIEINNIKMKEFEL